MKKNEKVGSTDNGELIKEAFKDSFRKLDPRVQIRNPVMFLVYIFSVVMTLFVILDIAKSDFDGLKLTSQLALWLWFTVLFANFAEGYAEGRGKAQANSLRGMQANNKAKKIIKDVFGDMATCKTEIVDAVSLRKGDLVMLEPGDIIPGDGEVVEGVASVDESAITGESAPVIRESGGDRSSVTGGTSIISDYLKVRITANPGETFIDKMISLVEGATRQKTPNEIALTILLIGLTIIFVGAAATLYPFAAYLGVKLSPVYIVALLVCLIPTTISGLLSSVGIAGMDRLMKKNIMAKSGRAVEAAGDISVLLLDKTGTITLGNRMASEFVPAAGVKTEYLADAAQMSSLSDETPEGRSIVILAKEQFNIRERHFSEIDANFVPFTAQTRMSGVDVDGRNIRKGAMDAIGKHMESMGKTIPTDVQRACEEIAKSGGTPLIVAENERVLGTIHLKDIVKGGIKERFKELRDMGIKTVMITGDNPMTAAAIAAEAGVDDFLAEATPENKMDMIKGYQSKGLLVAMTGDGTNDAPALAQADVGVSMNSGTQAAKDAGNMIDFDNNPTKLIEVVEVGKQLLMTRGALTTFSICNDIAKYFAVLPAMFSAVFPAIGVFNIMNLASPQSAILSAIIFNALIIIMLIPFALKDVKYRPLGATKILRNNLLIYGVGGIIAPFIGIKIIDILLVTLKLA